MQGIDISSYQENINWSLAKENIDFAIIRIGYGDDLTKQDDTKFLANVNACISNNIPFAVYIYSYAKNIKGTESIESEVKHTLRQLSKIKVKPFCCYIDMEDGSTIYLGKNKLTNFATYFCTKMTEAGYKAGVYSNEYWFNNYLDAKKIYNAGYSLWCAKYSSVNPNIAAIYDIWQYTSTAKIPGITGYVDMNIMLNDIINDRTPAPVPSRVNVYYRIKTTKHNWLPVVKNLDDYAGINNEPITGIAIKVDIGSIKYRAHIKGKNWLPFVTGYDINDKINGYAGNNRIIDAIEVYYYTPKDIRPYKKAKYKVNNYSWQYDTEKTNGQDGYAGKLGVPATKFQIIIE